MTDIKAAPVDSKGLKKVHRMMSGFLTDLGEIAPNDLDCVALEAEVMVVVREVGRTLTILNFRTAILSGRFDLVMRELVSRYSAVVVAAELGFAPSGSP